MIDFFVWGMSDQTIFAKTQLISIHQIIFGAAVRSYFDFVGHSHKLSGEVSLLRALGYKNVTSRTFIGDSDYIALTSS